MMGQVSLYKITDAEYQSIADPDPDAVFFITDRHVIILGGQTYMHTVKSERFCVSQVFAHDTYGAVAKLDAENGMELCGYYAEPVSEFEFHIVSANAEVAGNIVLKLGSEKFTIPVASELTRVKLNPVHPVNGIISFTRDVSDPADTLKDDDGVVSALVVDGRCC